jgi:HlyD family secretion protein
MKPIKMLCLFVFAGILLTACASAGAQTTESTPIPTVAAENAIVAEGRVEPIRYAEIAFTASGVVDELLVSEGEKVSEGQAIVRLGNSEALQADVARAEENLLQAQQEFDAATPEALKSMADAYDAVRLAQQRLDDFAVPSEFSGLTPAQAMEKMQAKLDKAHQDYAPYKDYRPNDKYVKELKKRLDDAWADYNRAAEWMSLQADLDTAKAQLEQARRDYAYLVGGSEAEDMTPAQAKYEAAQANLTAAKAALADVELRAPFAGTVAGLDIRVGESVNAGQVVATIADFSNWVVKTTDLTELDVVDIKGGQAVSIVLDAIPDASLNGKVESIGQTYAEKQGDIVYEVTIALSEPLPESMRWGMTAEVKFAK